MKEGGDFKKIFTNLAAETKKDKRVLLHKYSLPSLSLSLSFYLLCCCERKSETTEKKGARASN
jgi:hypothetical protein